MKSVVIAIVLLFLGIFGAKKFFEIREENAIKQAEKDYRTFISSRELKGDTLIKEKLLAKINARQAKVALEQKGLKDYISPEGYVFDCSSLEHNIRLGEAVARKKFNSRVGRFGPSRLYEWKPLMIPPVVTNPTDRMLAAKILRHLRDWKDPSRNIFNALLDGVKLNPEDQYGEAVLGLHTLRELEDARRKQIFGKLIDSQRAMVTLGKLEFHKGSMTGPYSIARDLIQLSDLFASEAVRQDEVKASLEMDAVMLDFLAYLAQQKKLNPREVVRVQRKLLDVDLSEAVFNAVRLARISSKGEMERKLTSLTNREVDSLSIFDSGYALTPQEKWQILEIYSRAGMMLNYEGDEETPHASFQPSILEAFGDYVNQEKADLELNKDAVRAYDAAMKSLENAIYLVLEKQVRRHEVAVKLGVANYFARTGEYPESLADLKREDIPELPTNPLTGKDYPYSFKNPTARQLAEEPSLKNAKPNVSFQLNAVSVVK